MADKKPVGKITHFFPKINVAVVELEDTLTVADRICIEGPHTLIEQSVDSMQIDRKEIPRAGKGQSVGLKVNGKVREKDLVYKL